MLVDGEVPMVGMKSFLSELLLQPQTHVLDKSVISSVVESSTCCQQHVCFKEKVKGWGR